MIGAPATLARARIEPDDAVELGRHPDAALRRAANYDVVVGAPPRSVRQQVGLHAHRSG